MLAINDVFVKYGDRVLLNNVSTTIKDKARVGLVGRNGAGKSTLLKIIAKDQSPDSGTIVRSNGTTLGFLHQELEMPMGKTVINEAMTAFAEAKKLEERIEEINQEITVRTDYESDAYIDLIQEFSDANDRFTVLGGHTMKADAERILGGLGFKSKDMDRLTDEFSGGWQMRIELAKMLLQKPDYLLLDEPTNHLDIESIIWLEGFLKVYEGVVIVISHDKMFLDNVTKSTVEVELGSLYEYKVPYSKYIALRAERKEKTASAFKNQQKMIAEKEKVITRFMAKATKTKMAQSMKKQLDKIERIEIVSEDTATMNIRFPLAPRSGRTIFEAKGIVKRYGDLQVLNGVDITMERGDRVAFVGQNGQGKTTLSKILIGVEPATAGEVTLGHNAEIGYYAQNQAEALQPDLTLIQTMEDRAPEHMRTKVRQILGAFMFSGEDAEKKVMVLSGGERARLALACMLLEPFNLLVLDEPTNHLDMLSKEVLKNALAQYDGTLIVVSHDREFLKGMTTKTIEFRDEKLHEYLGDVDYYLAKRKLENMRAAEKRTKETKEIKAAKQQPEVKKEDNLSPAERKKINNQRKRLQRDTQNIENKISNTEKNVKALEVEMGVGDFFNSPDSKKTLDKYNTLKSELETHMENWEEAQMLLEELGE
ncbi:MAG: ATP-binding cassette subfamily F protein 3 [Maribacter sp.]|jgi:ATP-binding cassette subfamily F protein 3